VAKAEHLHEDQEEPADRDNLAEGQRLLGSKMMSLTLFVCL
jgi:hypothetical protein